MQSGGEAAIDKYIDDSTATFANTTLLFQSSTGGTCTSVSDNRQPRLPMGSIRRRTRSANGIFQTSLTGSKKSLQFLLL